MRIAFLYKVRLNQDKIIFRVKVINKDQEAYMLPPCV